LSKYREGDEVTSGNLYRRIPPRISHWNRGRPTRHVFTPSRKQDPRRLSAVVAWLYRCPSGVVKDYPRYGVAKISVLALRRRGYAVVWKPEHDRGHVDICGDFQDPIPAELVDLCEIVLEPIPPIQ